MSSTHTAATAFLIACFGAQLSHQVHATTINVSANTLVTYGDADTVLDRTKYFTLHSSPGLADWPVGDMMQFAGYNAHLGRSFLVSGTMSTQPATKIGFVNATLLEEYCSQHPLALHGWPSQNVEIIISSKTSVYYPALGTKGFSPGSHAAAADMWSKFLKYCAPPWQTRFICEIMNEPNVKIRVANTTWADMTEIHIAIAQRIHSDYPDNKAYLVGGPTEAFPAYEINNFSLWNDTLKYFIDQAGHDVDYLSVHLYDTYDFNMDADELNYTARTGSNVDAILDLADAYTHSTLGHVVPHSISEFGSGFKASGIAYTPLHDWYIMRGVIGKTFQFMQRPDTLIKTVAFITAKSTWYTGPNSYPYDLWHKAPNGTYVLGHSWKFYSLFQHFQGKYILCSTSDVSVQVVALQTSDSGDFVVALHNLHYNSTTVDLAVDVGGGGGSVDGGADGVDGVVSDAGVGVGDGVGGVGDALITNTTRLIWNTTLNEPQLIHTGAQAQTSFSLLPGETRVIFMKTASSSSTTPSSVVERSFFCAETVVPMLAMQTRNFSVMDSNSGEVVYATLKLSLSTAEDPQTFFGALSVKVNGVTIDVDAKTQLAGKNYALKNGVFFGTIRLRVPVYAIAGTGEHSVMVQFPSYGIVSSVIILVGSSTSPVI